MRKDIRKRLEKALTNLKEPGGSTVRSIIKAVNKDTPIVSLRKLLEALQEGINEGFLCMYNGRFKLRQQLNSGREHRENDLLEQENFDWELKNTVETSESEEEIDDDSEFESDEEEEEDAIKYADPTDGALKKKANKAAKEMREKSAKRSQQCVPGTGKSNASNTKKKTRFVTKVKTKKNKIKGKGDGKNQKNSKAVEKVECSVLEFTSRSIPENKSTGSTAKLDVKKQRGPRCTSMKKDVRMPSKVHIPFVPPAAPQRNNNFNDLFRRSPEPVNGPLFDSFTLNNEHLGLFGSLC